MSVFFRRYSTFTLNVLYMDEYLKYTKQTRTIWSKAEVNERILLPCSYVIYYRRFQLRIKTEDRNVVYSD